MTLTKETTRQRKLTAINRKIAEFVMGETFTDETQAQAELSAAIGHITAAKSCLVEEKAK